MTIHIAYIPILDSALVHLLWYLNQPFKSRRFSFNADQKIIPILLEGHNFLSLASLIVCLLVSPGLKHLILFFTCFVDFFSSLGLKSSFRPYNFSGTCIRVYKSFIIVSIVTSAACLNE